MVTKKTIIRTIIVISLNILIYLVFGFLAGKYNHVFATYSPNPNTGLLIDVTLQSDFRYFWQAFFWPAFSLVVGLINGYSIRNQKKKFLYFFVVFILGLIFVASIDHLAGNLFTNGSTGLLSWCTGFDGKINLSFLSVLMWPITYFISLAFMCFLPSWGELKKLIWG